MSADVGSPAPPPAHVPEALVRPFDLDFLGSVGELFPRLDALRDQGRVLWVQTSMAGTAGASSGAWLFTRAEDIRHGLQRPDLFSSQLGQAGDIPPMIPTYLDPPDHTQYRRLLNPLFSPGVVAAMEASVRERIRDIVDGIADRGSCDFVADVAVQFPTRVFTSWIGLPEDETDDFVALVSAMIHGSEDEDERTATVAAVFEALGELIIARRADPTGDLMSQIMEQQVDGRSLTTDELFRIAFLLFLAGLDTVAAALSFAFWHLARSPGDRRAISTGAISTTHAVEELLRRHSFVNLPRLVARDVEFAGVELKRGDPVVLSTSMASRDPDEFEDPSTVRFERAGDGGCHSAFGFGPHRCLGAHLARLEMRVALEEWHARIPDYHLDGEPGAYAGSVMGLTDLPLWWPCAPTRLLSILSSDECSA